MVHLQQKDIPSEVIVRRSDDGLNQTEEKLESEAEKEALNKVSCRNNIKEKFNEKIIKWEFTAENSPE